MFTRFAFVLVLLIAVVVALAPTQPAELEAGEVGYHAFTATDTIDVGKEFGIVSFTVSSGYAHYSILGTRFDSQYARVPISPDLPSTSRLIDVGRGASQIAVYIGTADTVHCLFY